MGEIDMREMQVMVVCECRSCVIMQGDGMIEEDEFENLRNDAKRCALRYDGFRDLQKQVKI
jgi:hypothetical protein